MKRKISLLSAILLLVLSCTSCDSEDEAVSVETTPVVAVEGYYDTKLAAEAYCAEKGYELVECSSSEDAVVFVENGKYDYVLLDEFTTIVPEDYGLKFVESCEYSIRYCMVSSADKQPLINELNESILALNSDGTIDSIVDNCINGVGNSFSMTGGNEIRILCYPFIENRVYYDDVGNICGTDVDIMRAICEDAGYTPVFVPAEYDALFGMLDEGEGDLILMVDESSNDKLEQYVFSEVYFEKNFNVYESNIK